MDKPASKPERRRNKAFDETHTALIETAVRLVSEKGIEALSLSEVAREAGVNRTTIYYHFESREALVNALREWGAQQLAAAFPPLAAPEERARYITRFVLENPEVIALWTEDFLSPGDVRTRYPQWDGLVAGLGAQLQANPDTREIDPEIYTVIMLTVAMIGPRIYRNSVRPEMPIEEAIERFTAAQMNLLRRDGIGKK